MSGVTFVSALLILLGTMLTLISLFNGNLIGVGMGLAAIVAAGSFDLLAQPRRV